MRAYLTPDELSARLGYAISTKTLANWRSLGQGPRFRRFGNRIRYPLAGVIEWEQQNEFASTSEYPDSLATTEVRSASDTIEAEIDALRARLADAECRKNQMTKRAAAAARTSTPRRTKRRPSPGNP